MKRLWPWCITSILSAIYLWAAFSKFQGLDQFFTAIRVSAVSPGGSEYAIAYGTLTLEVGVAILLLIPGTRRLAAGGSLILSSLFAGYNTWRWIGSIPTPCNCLGPFVHITPLAGILLDAAMAIMSSLLLVQFSQAALRSPSVAIR